MLLNTINRKYNEIFRTTIIISGLKRKFNEFKLKPWSSSITPFIKWLHSSIFKKWTTYLKAAFTFVHLDILADLSFFQLSCLWVLTLVSDETSFSDGPGFVLDICFLKIDGLSRVGDLDLQSLFSDSLRIDSKTASAKSASRYMSGHSLLSTPEASKSLWIFSKLFKYSSSLIFL